MSYSFFGTCFNDHHQLFDCLLSIVNQTVPPTNNLINPDNETEGFDLVPLKSKKRIVKNVLSNSFGFGGTNASILIGNSG